MRLRQAGVDVLRVDAHGAAVAPARLAGQRRQRADHRAQERRLALAVVAHHRGTRAVVDLQPDARGEVGIIMRAGLYNGRDGLDMMVSNKAYELTPVGLVENGEDFDWAKFKVTQQGA